MKASLAAFFLALVLAGSTVPGRAQTATYTIPVILSQTGPGASPGGDEMAAIQAYEKLANRTGGIHGMQVHFQIYDDASSPQTAVQLTNTILPQKPAVMLGSTLAPATAAMLPFFKDGPVLYALTPLIFPDKGSYVFATLPLVVHVESVMFHYMRARGWTKVAILRTNDASGQDNAKAIDGALAEPDNRSINLTTQQLFNVQDINIAAQVSAIKFSGAQAIFVSATGAPFGTVLRSLADAGVDLPLFTGATNIAPDFIARFKQYVPKSGLWIVFPSYAKRDRGPKDPLRATIDEFYTSLEAAGLHPGAAHAFGWDEAKIVVAALRALPPNASAQAIRDWIEALHDFPGALGVYNFRLGDQHGLDNKSLYIVRYDANATGGDTQVVSDAGGTPLAQSKEGSMEITARLDAVVDDFARRCRFFNTPTTLERAQMFVRQHRLNTRQRNSVHKLAVATNCPHWEIRMRIIGASAQELIADNEFGEGKPHWEIIEDLGVSIGMNRDEIRATPPLPSTQLCWLAWETLTKNRHWLEGLVANMCSERVNVPGYGNGRQREVGWSGMQRDEWRKLFGLNDAQLAFWSVHSEADIDHSNLGWQTVAKYAEELNMADAVVEACRINLIVWENYFNGIHDAAAAVAAEKTFA